MASNLYDTGKPQRVIIESDNCEPVSRKVIVRHEQERLALGQCVIYHAKCSQVIEELGEVCDRCPRRKQAQHKPVTITPEFEVVKERKQLK